MPKLNFVAEIPKRSKRWNPPAWIAKLRRDRYLEIPTRSRSQAGTLRGQLVAHGFEAWTRSVNGNIFVYVRRGK